MPFKENGYGEEELLNDARMHLALEVKAEEFIAIAKEQYNIRRKYHDKGPIYYNESFGIRVEEANGVPMYRIFNDDPDAEWVEWGAHAGGKTEVLKYRIFGTTADILEAHERGASHG